MLNDFKVEGHASWQLIDDKTGIVLKEGSGKNHFNRWARRHFFNTGGEGNKTPLGRFTYISDDPRSPDLMHPEYDNTIRRMYATTPNPYIDASAAQSWLNTATFTRTITHTYTSPSAVRNIRWVGMLSSAGNTSPRQDEGSFQCVYTALAIDPVIVQSPGETFVLTYTIMAIPPTRKEFMNRFGMNYRAALEWFGAFLQQRDSSGSSNTLGFESRIHPFTFSPRDWFLDPDGIYGAADFEYENSGGGDGYSREAHSYGQEGARGGYLNTNPALDSADGAFGVWNGPIGMVCGMEGSSQKPGDDNVSHSTGQIREQVRWHALGMWPLAYEEGEVTRMFDHAVGRSFMFEEASFGATGLGSVDVRGPYKPPLDIGSPAHWLTQVIVTDSGDTDPATEASYIIRRKAWMSGARMPTIDLAQNADSGVHHGGSSRWAVDYQPGAVAEAVSAAPSHGSADDVNVSGVTQNLSGSSMGSRRAVWDGINSMWAIKYRVPSWYDVDQNTGLTKLRIGSPEASLDHVLSDDRRFVNELGNVMGTGVESSYALASDEAGRVFFGIRNNDESIAGNIINIIDVRKQARWIQRPSGSADGADTDRFTVSADDEFHIMYPFVAGDASGGKRLKIVNSPVGNNGTYVVAAHVDGNNVDLFQVDGSTPAVLAEEEDITWHWCVVSKPAVDHSVGALNHLAFDMINGRLWAIGSLGVQHTDDYGASWSTLFNESTVGGEVPLDDDHRANVTFGRIDGGGDTVGIDPQGSVYWVSSDFTSAGSSLHKLTINGGIGTDQEYSELNLTADFPTSAAGSKPNRFDHIFWEKADDNPAALADGAAPGGVRPMGALWVTSVAVATDADFYRVLCHPGPLDAADITPFDPSALPIEGGTLNASDTLCCPINFDGDTLLQREEQTAGNYSQYAYQVALGNFSEITSTILPYQYAPVWMRKSDGLLCKDQRQTSNMVSMQVGSVPYTYRWLEDDQRWIPFAGSSAQFDSMFNVARAVIDCDSVGTNPLPADQSTVVIDDGNGSIEFEFDTVPDGIIGGGIPVDISAAGDDNDVRDALITAINSSGLTIVAEIGGPGILWLRNTAAGTAGNVPISGTAFTGNFVLVLDMGGGNVADGGKKLAHAAWEETLDGVEVQWLETGAITPTDEFIKGESYSYAAVYGRARTNVNDWDDNRYIPVAPSEAFLEVEPVKTAEFTPFDVGWVYTSDPNVIGFGSMASGRLENAGYPFGSHPHRWGTMFGQGDTFDTGPDVATFDRGHFRASIDLNTPAEGTIDCDSVGTGVLPTDGQSVTLNDGINGVVTFEFDTNASLGIFGSIGVDISAAGDDDDVRDALITAINGASPLNIVAYVGGPGIVYLRSAVASRGVVGNQSIGGTAITGNFTASGMSGGLDAPEIHKLRLRVHVLSNTGTVTPNAAKRYAWNDGTNDTNLANIRVASADTISATAAEVDSALRWPSPLDTDPDAGALSWEHIHFLNSCDHHEGSNNGEDGSWQIVVDLAGAGLSQVQRTKRVWQILSNRRFSSGSGNVARIRIGSFEVLDADDNVIGFTDNSRLKKHHGDFEYGSSVIDEVMWIEQDQDDIDTVGTAAGPGLTDLVTLDGGVFDPALIDTTRDYFAWEEVGNPAVDGFIRVGLPSSDAPRPATRVQSMARIIGIEGGNTQLRLESALVPEGLVAADWEIRRPAEYISGLGPVDADPDSISHSPGSGYFAHTVSNAAHRRRFRVTRYGVSYTKR